MAAFRFRLQPVLDHKQRQEELGQLAHAQAQAVQWREEAVLSNLTTAQAAARDRLAQRYLVGRLDVWSIQLGLRHLDALAGRISSQTEVVARRRQETEAKRQELVQAMKERKVLDKLREHMQARWQQEQDHIEARFVDELATTRHARELHSAYRLPPPQLRRSAASGTGRSSGVGGLPHDRRWRTR